VVNLPRTGLSIALGAPGRRLTIDRRGLALRLGDRSIGHRDPGAVSCLILLIALAER
jgi:hypothetical protein